MEESRSVYTSIEFLRKLLLTFKPDDSSQQIFKTGQKIDTSDNITREEIVSRLVKDNIFQKVITNVALY